MQGIFFDIVEYANGPVDSGWGALRAGIGHPAPFGLKSGEIGNESNGLEFGGRHRFIHDAMKEKYPDLTYPADLSFTRRWSMDEAVFDIEDPDRYRDPRRFISRFDDHDERTPNQKPLSPGKLALTSGDAGPTRGNPRAALAESVYLTGCERDSDVVRMVSSAPLTGHIEGRTELTGAPQAGPDRRDRHTIQARVCGMFVDNPAAGTPSAGGRNRHCPSAHLSYLARFVTDTGIGNRRHRDAGGQFLDTGLPSWVN